MATAQHDDKPPSDKPTRRPSSGVRLPREPSRREPGFWSWRRPHALRVLTPPPTATLSRPVLLVTSPSSPRQAKVGHVERAARPGIQQKGSARRCSTGRGACVSDSSGIGCVAERQIPCAVRRAYLRGNIRTAYGARAHTHTYTRLGASQFRGKRQQHCTSAPARPFIFLGMHASPYASSRPICAFSSSCAPPSVFGHVGQ